MSDPLRRLAARSTRSLAAFDTRMIGLGAGLLAVLVLVAFAGAAPAALAAGLLALLVVD